MKLFKNFQMHTHNMKTIVLNCFTLIVNIIEMDLIFAVNSILTKTFFNSARNALSTTKKNADQSSTLNINKMRRKSDSIVACSNTKSVQNMIVDYINTSLNTKTLKTSSKTMKIMMNSINFSMI